VRYLLGFITHNWKLKLSAFALAVLLWTTVTADQLAVRWLMVPVAVEVRDDDFQLVQGPLPTEVQVRISGPRREFWDLGLNRPQLRLVITDVQDGTHSYPLDPQQLQIPRRVARGLNPIDVSPSRVTLTFRRVASAVVPVRVTVGSALREDLAFADTPRVEPATIRIRGPQPAVEAVTELRTRAVDFAGEEGAFQRTVGIDTTGISGLELSATEVTVSGRAERAVQRVIVDVPVRSPPGVLVVPGSVDVQTTGAESVLAGLTGDAVRVTVASDQIVSDGATGGRLAPLRVEGLPAGVRAVTEPRMVRVLAAPESPAIPDVRNLPPIPQPAPLPADTVAPSDDPSPDE
jgi:hypothetical protein